MTHSQVTLNVHGLRVCVEGSWPEVVESLRSDFVWFEDADNRSHDLVVRIDPRPVTLDPAANVAASRISPRSVTYRLPNGDVLTDYLGLATSRHHAGGGRLDVSGPDPALAEEIASNAIRAALVRHLDRTDRLAVHALGLAGVQGGVLIMLPSGGGKSTLAVEALRHSGVRILSDDMPVIDRSGAVHPHPVRIGLTIGDPAEAGRDGRKIERLGWRPKRAIEIEGISAHVQPEAVPLVHVVVANRNLGARSRLMPTDPGPIWRLLFQESIMRIDSGGGAAWITTKRRIVPTMRKVPRLVRRVTLCRNALQNASTWRLELGSDRAGCWKAIAPLLAPVTSSREAL